MIPEVTNNVDLSIIYWRQALVHRSLRRDISPESPETRMIATFQPNAITVDTHISKNSIDSSLSNLSG